LLQGSDDDQAFVLGEVGNALACAPTDLCLLSGSIRGVDSAFYEPSGQDTHVATASTAGPWSSDAQHGGPPSALAARALERYQQDDRQRLARVAIDIMRPIPVGKVSVRTRMVRPGRRITLVEAIMEANGQEVLHARGWRIERPAGPVPVVHDGGQPPPPIPPGTGVPAEIFSRGDGGYLAAIDWRFLDDEPGPTAAPGRVVWSRPKIPLLPGEDPSPMSRALLVADSGSGIGAALPSDQYLFINVDLTVVLPRDPAGAWLLLESSTTVGSDGTGLAMTRLSDQIGACGRGWQTLLVAPR
jgi:acyl-CoA thioesterase superfamily protein/acyl-Coa thioesterase superfamily protein